MSTDDKIATVLNDDIASFTDQLSQTKEKNDCVLKAAKIYPCQLGISIRHINEAYPITVNMVKWLQEIVINKGLIACSCSNENQIVPTSCIMSHFFFKRSRLLSDSPNFFKSSQIVSKGPTYFQKAGPQLVSKSPNFTN